MGTSVSPCWTYAAAATLPNRQPAPPLAIPFATAVGLVDMIRHVIEYHSTKY